VRFERVFPKHKTVELANASHFLQEDAGEQIGEEISLPKRERVKSAIPIPVNDKDVPVTSLQLAGPRLSEAALLTLEKEFRARSVTVWLRS
jgi:Asp-tRNA(Asn)/Glu-tRNA(Gln) amidotransferase A subunit family amidase